MREGDMKYRVATAILGLMILPLYAQCFYPDSAVVIGYTRDWAATGEASGNRVSVRDSQGNIHVVYCYRWEPSPVESSEVFYVFSTDNGIAWSEPENVSRTDSHISIEPSLVVDSQDRLHCVWKQNVVGTSYIYDLYYSNYDGTSWLEPENITKQYAVSNTSHYSSMVVDSKGHLHLVYGAPFGYYNVFYMYYDGITWSEPLNLSNVSWDADFPCIAVDLDDNLHVVWRERRTDGPIMYTIYDGVSWTKPEQIMSIPPGQTYQPCIVVNSQGRPRVICEWGNLPSDSGDVYYTVFNGISWSKPLNLSNTCNPSSYHSLAIDSLDNLYVVWSEATNVPDYEIHYRTHDGVAWSEIMNITQDSAFSYCPNLGNPVKGNNVDLIWVSQNEINREVVYLGLSLTGIAENQPKYTIQKIPRLIMNPNPFKNTIAIDYYLTTSLPIKIMIYNTTGRLIGCINQEIQQSGNHRIVWEAKNLPAGVYFARLEGGDYSVVKKIVKIK